MTNTVKDIQQELRRIGCGINVSASEGRPDLCWVAEAGELSGSYKADHLLNALTQLRTPDTGEDDCADIYATLGQIGFYESLSKKRLELGKS